MTGHAPPPGDRIADDAPTLVAVGAAVAVAASLAHEAVGHGVGCLADGGTITLLTFLVFRCEGAGVLADGGGPVGAFVVAALCLVLARRRRAAPSAGRVFVFALGVQTMLWVCAQTMREGLDGGDDWGHVARDLAWPPAWGAVAVAIGLAGYAATVRLAARPGVALARGRPARLLIPYASACLFAVAFGALWSGDRAGSALDAFTSFGVAPLGYLLVIRAAARAPDAPPLPPIARDRAWIVGTLAVAVAFGLTIARGVGRLA